MWRLRAKRIFNFALIVISTLATPLALAHEGHVTPMEELVVYGRAENQVGIATAASSGQVGDADIQLFSRLRVGELVESIPGMVATQHSGTGKANQYYLRGFNLDHGTDFSAHAQGVPLNMRSHGHGQGYLDLNFLIPEMVATTKFRKGPYHAAVGDFSAAGTAEFLFYERLASPLVSASLGADDYQRGLLAGSADLGSGTLTGALDLTRYDGPWQRSENLEQDKLQLRYSAPLGDATLLLDIQAYEGRWDSTDQIPARAVSAGLIDELGLIDPDLGGSTDRYAATASIEAPSWRVSGYIVDYDFSLYSNFTYFLEDPTSGDEFEQRDRRRVYGLNYEGTRELVTGGRPAIARWGVQSRLDDVGRLGLYRTASRNRLETLREDALEERSVGMYGEIEVSVTDRLRAIAGMRGDYYDWDVDAALAANRGDGSDTIYSPKLTLAYRFSPAVEGYANWGRGFHSNDVRGVTATVDPISGDPIDAADALVAAQGAELGVRIEHGDRMNASLVGFWLELDSELVFVGDAGGTEASGASQRRGIEAALFWQATQWLAVDANYTWTDAEFRSGSAGGDAIPGAVGDTASLGLSAVWSNGWFANARMRFLDDIALVEDRSVNADASLLVNAGVGVRFGDFEIRVDVLNALDSDDRDISYFYASRLPGEPAGGVEDTHYHPLEPRTIRTSFLWRPSA